MSAECVLAIDTLLATYIDGVFAGHFEDEMLHDMLSAIGRISGRVYSFNVPTCRVFMGMTICNKVILRCINFDKTRYITILSDVFTTLVDIPPPDQFKN
jgi:hypothetical protein